jgi:hypothetical protein
LRPPWFGQSIKVACAFERMMIDRKFIQRHPLENVCHLRSESISAPYPAYFTPSIVIASPRNEGAAIQSLDRLGALSLSNGLDGLLRRPSTGSGP